MKRNAEFLSHGIKQFKGLMLFFGAYNFCTVQRYYIERKEALPERGYFLDF